MTKGSTDKQPSDSAPAPGVDGKTDMLGRLYCRYRRELVAFVRSKVGAGPPDPEDIAQSAFEKFAGLESSKKVRNPRAFLYRISFNLIVDFNRREQTRNSPQVQTVFASETENTDDLGPERVSLGVEALGLLRQAVLSLAPRDRSFLLANRLEGLSYAEIARRAKMSPSRVREVVEQSLAVCEAAMLDTVKLTDKQQLTSQGKGEK